MNGIEVFLQCEKKKEKYGCKQYKIFSEDEKQSIVEYSKNYS